MNVASSRRDREDTDMREAVVPYSDWYARLGQLRPCYRGADPFPHLVLDNFLQPEAAERFLDEFPPLDPDKWVNWVHVNERKYGQVDRAAFGPGTAAVYEELTSPAFAEFLTALSGIEGLFPDPHLESAVAGGLHQSTRGGFLNMHADFTVHPHHPDWMRRMNVLLFLNKNWDDAYGGHLEFWDRQMKRCCQRIAPIFNRCVIFRTDEYSYHGHPTALTCPEGVTRKSMAVYFFTKGQNLSVRSTHYRARPGDGARSILIYADNVALRLYDRLRRRFRFNDQFMSRLLGFSQRRKRD
jgi:hypothetical protein